jgi:putative heme transporter
VVTEQKVPYALDRLAAYSWRLIVIAVVALSGLWVLSQAGVVVFPVVVALFLTRALSPVAAWMRRHRWPPGLAAAVCVVGFTVALAGLIALAVRSFAGQGETIRPTLTQAIDDIEDWLVTDSPFNVSRANVDTFRDRAATRVDSLVRSSGGAIADQATLVAEVVAGTVLAIILTFFMLRDGLRFADWVASRAGGDRPARMRGALDAAWATLAGYLRGAALLGVLEAVVTGLTLKIVGGSLVAPVMILTLLGAFVPVVGAVLAGIIAVLVALVTAGTGPAIVVAVVALAVQQLDNDVLAPLIYGRALELHPVVVLLSVVGGGALFGLAGTVLAVPAIAVTVKAIRVYRAPPESK